MIKENEDYVTKSKLTITVSKHNISSQTNKQTNKQTQRHRNWQTLSQKNKKTYLQIDTQADLSGHTHTERETQNEK